MTSRWKYVLLLSLVLSLGSTSVVQAQEVIPEGHARLLGEIIEIDLAESAFTLQTLTGDEQVVRVSERTRFRSPEGEIQGLGDLEAGVKALVIGEFRSEGELHAFTVAVRGSGDFPLRVYMRGEVLSIDLGSNSFDLSRRNGELATVRVDEDTQYRNHDGSIEGLSDLNPGIKALVIAIESEQGSLLARQVAAIDPEDIPEGLRRFRGEITQVVPGQGTFTLETLKGAQVTFQTGEHTRFEGRNMEVEDIHDLKKGMRAAVAAVPGEGNELEAMFVLVWEEGEFFDRPEVDVRKAGRIVDLEGRSFTLQTLSGEEIRFEVDEETVYRSRSGEVQSFSDLEVGMPALVGALEQEGGGFLARWVGVGEPGEGPPPAYPGQGPGPAPGPPWDAG